MGREKLSHPSRSSSGSAKPTRRKKRDECTRGQFGVTPAACLGHPPLVGHPPSCLKTWYVGAFRRCEQRRPTQRRVKSFTNVTRARPAHGPR